MRGTPLKWFKRRLNFVSRALHCLPQTMRRVDLYYRANHKITTELGVCKLTKVVAGTLSTAAIPGIPIIADLAGKGLFL